MTVVLYVLICLSALVFTVATAVRAALYARAPLHLRWELYPVPHEAPGRAAHGGSYFEESSWWTRPARANHWGTVRAMFTEMLFLRALREFNPRLWRRSFPFHFGLYLLAAAVVLVLAAAGLAMASAGLSSAWPGTVVRWGYRLTGIGGLVCAAAGASALLLQRITDPGLRPSTTPADLFNLAAFIVAMGLTGAGYLLQPAESPGLVGVIIGLLRWDTAVTVPGVLAAGLAWSALLVAYIPFTHMSHFVGKYFTYHAVRWDDAVSRPGSALERQMAGYLTYRPTWAAPHVAADGTRTWAEVVTAAPPDKAKR
jgi:nitrate reductase gamma subunit